MRPLRGRAGQLGDRDIGRARQRRGLLDGGAAAIGEHETAIAAVARDAIGKGKRQHDAGGGRDVLARPPFCCRHLLRPALRQAARAACARRAVAAKLIEPVIEIDAVAAEAALGQEGRDFGGLFAGAQPMRIHDHARQPRRQRQRPQALAFRRDPAIGHRARRVLRAGCRLPSAPARAAGRETPACAGSRTPHCARSSTSEERSAEKFQAGYKRPAKRSAVRPTAGSKRRARCGRRGPGADRPRRARRARSQAGSGRYQARSAAPAPCRNRRQCARPRWSAKSRRSRSPARPCAGPSAPARWHGPARRHRARRTAARSRRSHHEPAR